MNIILVTKEGEKELRGSLTDICKIHNLPYRILNLKTFPFEWEGWNFEKLEYKKQYINK